MDIDGQKRLVGQCTRWVERLYRVNRDALAALTAIEKQYANITVDWLHRFSEEMVNPIDAAFDNAFEQAYVLSLSLEQLYKYTGYLKAFWLDALRDVGRSYRAAYGSSHIGDLRNLFEHEADYVAGHGRKPQIALAEHPDVRFDVDKVNGGVQTVRLFGKTYMVQGVVERGLALHQPLIEFRQILNDREHSQKH